jgi:hypothetical protein
LAILSVAFLMRVVGQVLVASGEVTWLPSMEQWQSGLLPYPLLLLAQIVILCLQAWICRDLWQGRGYFASPHLRGARWIARFSYAYAAAMVARYVVTMWLHPEWRWFDHTIPIWFHLVLAAFLWTYSQFHLRRLASPIALGVRATKDSVPTSDSPVALQR